ncbi:MAG: hypothetical protein ACI8XB_001468 [Patiriisocius sp.]|jgi:hypothetical protein
MIPSNPACCENPVIERLRCKEVLFRSLLEGYNFNAKLKISIS